MSGGNKDYEQTLHDVCSTTAENWYTGIVYHEFLHTYTRARTLTQKEEYKQQQQREKYSHGRVCFHSLETAGEECPAEH